MSILFKSVEIEGVVTDVLVSDGHVCEVGTDLRTTGAEVIDGYGGALLPGLHDHHVHLLAVAAASESVDCSDLIGLLSLGSAPGTGWVRGVDYHEKVDGPLDRHRLDALVPDRPVRVQHRSGALWMLNSRALRDLGNLEPSPDVEIGSDGEPSGRLWRYDHRLLHALTDAELPDLTRTVRTLSSFGITGVTDASPQTDAAAAAHLAAGLQGRCRLTLLAADVAALEGMNIGPRKILLPDHALPTYPELCELVVSARAQGRGVAVHCVTRESLLLTIAVLRDVGSVYGDRIEHASVVPPEARRELAALGVAVVTQPSLLRLRGDDYLRDVDPDDVDLLYPHKSLLSAGVPVSASSDAPYGDLDPWASIADARSRATNTGQVLGSGECVSARTALSGYLSRPESPGGTRRAVRPGETADLCLLHLPLAEALRGPTRAHVRMTIFDGVPLDAASKLEAR